MSFYKFDPNSLFYNRIKTYPSVKFQINSGTIIYNNDTQHDGEFSTNVKNVPPGHISLYEINVDRPSGQLVYPFVTKGGTLTSFKTTTTASFNNDFVNGDTMTGSYPLSASISSDRFAASADPEYYRSALRNSLNSYSVLSPHYLYSSSLGDKSTQVMRIISIPSIFYGSSIKKGSVSLRFYMSGTLLSELRDDTSRGELRQVSSGSSVDSGSVGGVVMYDHGFILLTGSWDLTSSGTDIYHGASATAPQWTDFGFTGSTAPNSSFQLAFSGTNYVPTVTMFAHMPKGHLNHSNNPTYIEYGQTLTPTTGSTIYKEPKDISIVNVKKTNFRDPDGKFQKITYINKVGIYDKNQNLIAIAKLANPIRKRETDEFTLKLKLDI